MRNFVYFLLSTILICLCAGTGIAQRATIDPAQRDRARERQRAVENPANNPFKIEPYEPLKPRQPEALASSPMRALIELQAVGIVDGDTLIIANTANQRLFIRLQGIDAPESAQSFGNNAQENLAKLVVGKKVTLEFDPHGKPDKEGRIVAKVMLEGQDIALEQIRAGFAWYCKDYKKDLSESDRYTYADAEKLARSMKRGLWQEATPQPPWKYRPQ